MDDYDLKRITTETWRASCNLCGKPFLSDIKSKAIEKVEDHLRDKHERHT